MKFDFVFLLPFLAIAMAVIFPLFSKVPNKSATIKSKRYRKIQLGRLTIIVLPIATLAALVSTVSGLNNLSKALLFCAVVLIPAFLVHFYMTLRYGKQRKTDSNNIVSASENTTEDANNLSVPRMTTPINKRHSSHQVRPVSPNHETNDIPPINLSSDSYSTNVVSETKSSAPSLHMKERAPNENTAAQTADGIDSPAEVREQLDRVSDLIDSHDLGNSDYSLFDDDVERTRFSLKSDAPLAIESALTTVDMSSTELSKMSSNQISELVTTLRIDKTKLQKLVIAQQASIESERKAHDQSRVVARDAIKIMRDARNRQKFAEKMTRRERTERKRVEQQYKKVANALRNAMSIIESRQAEKTKVSS